MLAMAQNAMRPKNELRIMFSGLVGWVGCEGVTVREGGGGGGGVGSVWWDGWGVCGELFGCEFGDKPSSGYLDDCAGSPSHVDTLHSGALTTGVENVVVNVEK